MTQIIQVENAPAQTVAVSYEQKITKTYKKRLRNIQSLVLRAEDMKIKMAIFSYKKFFFRQANCGLSYHREYGVSFSLELQMCLTISSESWHG